MQKRRETFSSSGRQHVTLWGRPSPSALPYPSRQLKLLRGALCECYATASCCSCAGQRSGPAQYARQVPRLLVFPAGRRCATRSASLVRCPELRELTTELYAEVWCFCNTEPRIKAIRRVTRKESSPNLGRCAVRCSAAHSRQAVADRVSLRIQRVLELRELAGRGRLRFLPLVRPGETVCPTPAPVPLHPSY